MKIALLMPVYNQAPWKHLFINDLNSCFAKLQVRGFSAVLIFVDDGSTIEETELPHHFDNLLKLANAEVYVAQHNVNRGQGAALMTALQIARSTVKADLFVTIDADGQHAPDDIFSMLDVLEKNKLNIVFGNRFAGELKAVSYIPLLRRLVLRTAAIFERYLTGLRLSDAHNGYRLFDAKVAQILNIKQDRMAHATEIKQLVAHSGLRYGEAPITIQYTTESLLQGQQNANAFNILRELFQGWMFQ